MFTKDTDFLKWHIRYENSFQANKLVDISTTQWSLLQKKRKQTNKQNKNKKEAKK